MFEKEAYEYGEEKIDLATSMRNPQIETMTRQGFKDGAEFGYNKANEWHFVSKEGFPNKDDIYLIIKSDGLHLGDYCRGGDGDIDCQSWCDYPSEEEIQDDSVIAWKEIVLPKEIKEK
jgi:hypothetical protein